MEVSLHEQRRMNMTRYYSAFSAIVLVASSVASNDRISAQEPGFDIVLPALTNGDVNGDWALDVSDAIHMLGHLFLGGAAPVEVLCGAEVAATQNGDTNGDGTLDVSDSIRLLGFLFSGGPEPVSACGLEAGAGAAATRVPVSFVATLYVPTGPPDRTWVDDEGVTHVRGFHAVSDVVGDWVGSEVVDFNQNVDAAGNGDGFASFVFDVTWAGLSGTFEGRTSVSIEAGVTTADFVMHGTGEFEGMKAMGRAVQREDGSFLHEGVVLIPETR